MNCENRSVKGEKYVLINRAVHLDTWISLADPWIGILSTYYIPSILACRDKKIMSSWVSLNW